MSAGNFATLDLGDLSMERGAHILIKRALRGLPVGGKLEVSGRASALAIHLAGWARGQGHALDRTPRVGEPVVLIRGNAESGRWRGANTAGAADPTAPGAVAEEPPSTWGLAARGARVEAGSPRFHFPLSQKDVVWADEAPRMYARAAAAQWDPATAIDGDAPIEHPEEVEDAVVQVMTYLVENETAALIVPTAFLARLHPHFREVMGVLAVQAADEARHIEVFTRRMQLRRDTPGLSTAGGQASLKTLLDEPDFALASFMLSVLGEGSFLSLLWYLNEHVPDAVTRDVSRMSAQDEARHVAFGMAHLKRHAEIDPHLRPKLAAAVERRHSALQHTAGLNEEVFDGLVVLAAGSFEAADIQRGFDAVIQLKDSMDNGRRGRLEKLGFTPGEAEVISSLHTRNFM